MEFQRNKDVKSVLRLGLREKIAEEANKSPLYSGDEDFTDDLLFIYACEIENMEYIEYLFPHITNVPLEVYNKYYVDPTPFTSALIGAAKRGKKKAIRFLLKNRREFDRYSFNLLKSQIKNKAIREMLDNYDGFIK